MLTDVNGTPQPPSDIVARLEAIDPALGVRWMGAGGEEDNGYWAITHRWPKEDKRREMIKDGKMSPGDDFDAICFLPRDCPVDEAYGFVVNGIRQATREDTRSLLNDIDKWNAKREAEAWKAATDPAMEQAEGAARAMGGIPFSAGGIEAEAEAAPTEPDVVKAKQVKRTRKKG